MIVVSVSATPWRTRSVRSSTSELGGVDARHSELVIRRAGQVQHLDHLLEAGDSGGEIVRVDSVGEVDAHQRLQCATPGGWVNKRREARDDARPAQTPDAVGGGVSTQADGSAQVAP